MVVEEVSDECEVKLGVASNKRGRCQEFSARRVKLVGILQYLFGALVQVGGL